MLSTPLLVLSAGCTAALGALGGLGGAVLLVPLLVLTDMPAGEAAPLGLLSVAAGSLAATSRQLRERSVNHRLGVTTETAATAGAIAGAVVSGSVSDSFLTYVLAATAGAAAIAGGHRKGIRNPPVPGLGAADVGERHGELGGAYPVGDAVAPYSARRLPFGLAAMAVSGLVAGLAGTSGGFIKTPATSELMHVPVKVAAATTTFTIGVTSAAALIVFALQGRLDVGDGTAIVAGSLVGGWLGAALQARLSPPLVRRSLSVVLLGVAVALVLAA